MREPRGTHAQGLLPSTHNSGDTHAAIARRSVLFGNAALSALNRGMRTSVASRLADQAEAVRFLGRALASR